MPMPILKLFRYLPGEPFTRLRNLNYLFRQYGKQILRERSQEIHSERNLNSNLKDVMIILSASFLPLPAVVIHDAYYVH